MDSTPLPESVDGNRKAARHFKIADVTKGEWGTGGFDRHRSPEVKLRLRIYLPCRGSIGYAFHEPAAGWVANVKSTPPSLRNQPAGRIFATTFPHRLANAAGFSVNIPHD